MDYNFYYHWSIIPFVLLVCFPTVFAIVISCIGGCYNLYKYCTNTEADSSCLMRFGRSIEKTLIYKLVVNKYGVKDNKIYGYEVSSPVIYYLFLFTVYLYSATSGTFWTKFLVEESHKCNLADTDKECFYLSNKKPVPDNCTFDSNIIDDGIVCYKLIFAYGPAFNAAAGVVTACFTAATTIVVLALMLSGGGTKKSEKKNYIRLFLTVIVMVSIIIVATVLYAYIIIFINSSGKDVTETANVTIIYIAVMMACCVPWYFFQEVEENTTESQKQEVEENTTESQKLIEKKPE